MRRIETIHDAMRVFRIWLDQGGQLFPEELDTTGFVRSTEVYSAV